MYIRIQIFFSYIFLDAPPDQHFVNCCTSGGTHATFSKIVLLVERMLLIGFCVVVVVILTSSSDVFIWFNGCACLMFMHIMWWIFSTNRNIRLHSLQSILATASIEMLFTVFLENELEEFDKIRRQYIIFGVASRIDKETIRMLLICTDSKLSV